MKAGRRAIPQVGKVLDALGPTALPRPVVATIVRQELARLRAEGVIPSLPKIVARICVALEELRRSRIQPVINGTGVIIHTNLGRAPLDRAAIRALAEIGASYSNLEFDLETGARGQRGAYLERTLALLCHAEAATVVNNCAAALVLIVRHCTRRKPEIVISRGELIQIGGGFRIPEILEASGARLREVGTTNRTTAKDYARAIGPQTGMILKVHRSNFFMTGFVESPRTEELAELARARRVPFVENLGSGALVPTEPPEPTPAETLQRGVDLVCFSGDKLLGGPQAGIIAGKKGLVAALKREPFFRALRCDKLVLSALQATAETYLAAGENSLPVHQMMQLPNETLLRRAEAILQQVDSSEISIGRGKSQIGGGTLPRASIDSVTLVMPESFAAPLRHGAKPMIGYVERGRFILDLRTIFPEQDAEVVSALREQMSWRGPSATTEREPL